MSNFLNELSSTIAPSTGFRQLAPGKYDGQITGIVQKELNGSPVWEIDVQTPQGKTNALIWGFNPTDLQLAEQDFRSGNQDSKYLKGVMMTIDKAKKMLCDVGVWDEKNTDDVKSRPWSGGENSVLGSLAKMIGKACSVVVQPRRDDATKMNTYINPPRPTGQGSTLPSFDNVPSQFDISRAPSLDQIPF
jgi:hypothetical protein